MRFTAVRWLFASALGFASAVFASGPEILYFGGGRQAAAGDESMRGRVLRATEVTSDFIDRDPRHRVALADIDGDGRLDAAVSNPEKGTINILLSNGTSRSYGRQMDFPAIALLDLNGDDKLDLIAVDHESIVIRPGNGDGTFGEPRIADSCGRFVAPAAISAADFNRDGWIDLVIADVRPNRLVMLMGSSDGTFRSSTEYRLIVTPASLSVGDFDADGWPDVAFANENDRAVGVLLRSEFANHDCPTASPQDRARLPITVNATQTIFIGFDQDAAGSDIPNLSLIDEQYAALGVHFNATFYAARRALAFPSYSANFSLNYLCTFFGTAGGDRPCIEPIGGGAAVLVADIDFPIEFASIEGYTRNDGEFDRDGLIIDAYGAGGNFLAEGSDFRSNDPPPYTREGILRAAVSASGIRRIVIDPIDTDALDSLTLRFNSNNPPVANSQSVTTPEDTPRNITLTGSDPDGNALTFIIVTGPAHGMLSGGAPNVTYTPNSNYNGPDSFTFKVNDGSADSNVATVSINVAPVNDPPVANSQSVTTPEDTPRSITLTGSDVDGDSLTFTIVTGVAHGTLSGGGANVTYTPNANYNGPDSFTFKVNDGTADSNVATVSINVTPVNDPPVANAQSVTTPEDTPIGITLTGSDVDGDALSFTIVTGPAHGTLSGSGANVIYTPNANYNGPDSFTFKVNDGTVDSNVATVSIDVTPVNDAPVANPQSVITPEDTPIAITLTGSDVDGDPLTFAIVTGPAHGTLSGSGANVTYTPNANYNGPDSFTFRVNDGTVNSNIATVSITVTPVNDPPVANPQTVSACASSSTPIVLTGSDPVEGSPVTFIIVTPPLHGTLSGTPPNVTYTPATFTTGDSFTFKVNDGESDSNIATVALVDRTPPTISCPADVTVGSKCGAAGRVVGYPAPIAGDFCSRTVAVSCSNPSGSTFPNGMTTVTCTAVDLAGNSSSCSFHVTVRTPQFAIQALIDRVVAILGPQEAGSFVAKLEAALQSLEKDCHLTPAINQLEAFIREVDAQRGKKLTDAQAGELIAAAQQIIAQLLQP